MPPPPLLRLGQPLLALQLTSHRRAVGLGRWPQLDLLPPLLKGLRHVVEEEVEARSHRSAATPFEPATPSVAPRHRSSVIGCSAYRAHPPSAYTSRTSSNYSGRSPSAAAAPSEPSEFESETPGSTARAPRGPPPPARRPSARIRPRRSRRKRSAAAPPRRPRAGSVHTAARGKSRTADWRRASAGLRVHER